MTAAGAGYGGVARAGFLECFEGWEPNVATLSESGLFSSRDCQ